jgi:hypothetical protein
MAQLRTETEVWKEAQTLLQTHNLSRAWKVSKVYRYAQLSQTTWYVVLTHKCGRPWENTMSWLRHKLRQTHHIECRKEPTCLLKLRKQYILLRIKRGHHLQDIAHALHVTVGTLRQYIYMDRGLTSALKAKPVTRIEQALKDIRGYITITRKGSPPDTWESTIVKCKCIVCGRVATYKAKHVLNRIRRKVERGHVCQSCSSRT